MFRRRRRRSSFARRSTTPPWMGFAAAGVVLIGLFLFFMRQADVLAPAPREISVPLPAAFKE